MWKLLVLAQTQNPQGDFAMKDIPGLLLAVAVAAVIIFLGSGAWRRPQRERHAEGAGDERRGGPAAAPAAAAPAPTPAAQPAPAPAASDEDEEYLEPPPHPTTQPSDKRLHTTIVGGSGNTKTQSQIALFVSDIARGDQVVWGSTNAALYNAETQRTDLRPITDYFEVVYEEQEIAALLKWAWAEVKRRRELARKNISVGHRIALHFDEWPELAFYFKQNDPEALVAFGRVLEQGRKFRVAVNIGTHNFLTDTLGISSGQRDLFQTRIVANTDADSWLALMGKGVSQRRVVPGSGQFWMPALNRPGVVPIQMQMVTPAQITQILRRPPQPFAPIRAQLEAFMGPSDEDDAGGNAPHQAGKGRGSAQESGVRITARHLQLKAMVEEARPEIARLMQQPKMTLNQARKKTETSARALARRLEMGENGGNASMAVSAMLVDLEKVFGLRLYDETGAVEANDEDASVSGGEEGEEREEREGDIVALPATLERTRMARVA